MTGTPQPQPLLVATTNRHKTQEYAALLAELPLRLLTLADVGLGEQDVEEGDESFLANARLKAHTYWGMAQAAGHHVWVLADDSGLEVDALGGAPGVRSTRWAGADSTAEERNTGLLARLTDVPAADRGADFRCVIAVLDPTGAEYVAEGTLRGRIAAEPRPPGSGGFGYDPIFELPERGLTVAELAPGEKHTISHRARAVAGIRPALAEALRRPVV